jgi:hypothetical protein
LYCEPAFIVHDTRWTKMLSPPEMLHTTRYEFESASPSPGAHVARTLESINVIP